MPEANAWSQLCERPMLRRDARPRLESSSGLTRGNGNGYQIWYAIPRMGLRRS
jgi:hypothetical protein